MSLGFGTFWGQKYFFLFSDVLLPIDEALNDHGIEKIIDRLIDNVINNNLLALVLCIIIFSCRLYLSHLFLFLHSSILH